MSLYGCVRGDATNAINANATKTVHGASSMIAIVSSTNSGSVALASLHYGGVAHMCEKLQTTIFQRKRNI